MKAVWPLGVIFGLVVLFYLPFFTKGLRPIPADITPGMYYPWLDNKFPEFPNNIPVKNPLPSDVVSLTYPLRLLSIDLLKNREWPWWNSLILSGTPLLANFQSAALYPLNFLYFLNSNFSLVWSWQVILQPLLAIVFTYWFLRSYGLNKIACLFGAATWAFGGFFTIWGQYNTVTHAIMYLPLGLLALKKISDNLVWGLGLVVAIVCSIYAGNPPMTLIMVLTMGIFCFIKFGLSLKSYIWPIIFGVLALGLACPILIPGFLNSSLSIRQSDTVAVDNNIKFLPVRQLVTLIAPDFYGNPTTLNHWAPGLYDNLTIFVGSVPLLLFLLTLVNKFKVDKDLILFYKIIFWGSWILMVKNPISMMIGSLPILGLGSMVMSRFFVITNFGIAICSAIMIDHILKNEIFNNKRLPYLLVLFLVIAPLTLVTVIYVIFNYGNKFIINIPNPNIWDMTIVIKETFTSIRNSLIPLIILVISGLVLIFYKKFNKYLVVGLLFGLNIFDLLRFFNKYNTFVPEKYLYPKNETISYLQKSSGRFIREGGELMPSNMWMPYGLMAASGFDTLHSYRYNGFISLVNGSNIQNNTNRFLEIDNINSAKVDFLSINNLVALKRSEGRADKGGKLSDKIDLKKYRIVNEDKSTVVLENKSAMPLVFAVNDYKVAINKEELNGLLKASDLTKTVVLEKEPKIALVNKVNISELNYDKQKISFTTDGQGLLVTSTSFDPGWQLTIDGKKSEILIANYAFMALKVSEGKHEIKLFYQPETFVAGVVIFKISVAILLILMVVKFKFGRRNNIIIHR